MDRKIEVVPYDPIWPVIYQNEVDRILYMIQDVITTFYHMGSSAVTGLAAKPTIDILAVVPSLEKLDAKDDVMLSLGYQIMGENGIPGRRYYRRLSGEVHLFHIHAFEVENPEIRRHLNFRDYLCENEAVRKAYEKLKYKLARRFPYDSLSYTNGKSAFIQKVDQAAAEWRASLKETDK
jgi:GrpB-like predicted nucleotidyltransferase (UPF0157 family)